jgi:hypothetical protein
MKAIPPPGRLLACGHDRDPKCAIAYHIHYATAYTEDAEIEEINKLVKSLAAATACAFLS